jgi:DNA processing protein
VNADLNGGVEAQPIASVNAEHDDALISWSALAEPGDVGAAWLVATLGPGPALAWLRLASQNSVAASMELSERATPREVDEAMRMSEKWRSRLDVADAGAHRERARQCGARVVTRGSTEWPPCLDDLGPVAPYALWVRGSGHLASLMTAGIAMVGARAATAYGEHVASTMAAELMDNGWTIVSGGAYGIDAAAHRTALAIGDPTVAVMAGGVDRLYPTGNANLLHRILDGGVVVSEVPPGYAPQRARFLSRNRLIATARATVVVEAASRSGALSTARHAASLLRPVGAVPGPITSASSAGCHALIRDGLGTLVTRGADVIELAGPVGVVTLTEAEGRDATSSSEGGSDGGGEEGGGGEGGGGEGGMPDFASLDQRQAYGAIGPRGEATEAIARESGLTLAETLSALGGLELAGLARRDGIKWRRNSGR